MFQILDDNTVKVCRQYGMFQVFAIQYEFRAWSPTLQIRSSSAGSMTSLAAKRSLSGARRSEMTVGSIALILGAHQPSPLRTVWISMSEQGYTYTVRVPQINSWADVPYSTNQLRGYTADNCSLIFDQLYMLHGLWNRTSWKGRSALRCFYVLLDKKRPHK